MCLVSLSKQLSQRKSFLCLVNFEIRMWQSTSLKYAVVSLCPLGSAGLEAISSFRYPGKLLSLARLSVTANLGWLGAGDLVI